MKRATKTKTDNRSLSLKVSLRRLVLREAGLVDLRVLDLCAGEGHVWNAMRAFTNVVAYTPCDKEPRMPGTIKGDLTERFLAGFDLAAFNVIDVDTYGSPWEVFEFLSPRIKTTTALFLTHGLSAGIEAASGKSIRSALGIPDGWKLPAKKELVEYAAKRRLASAVLANPGARVWRVACRLNVTLYGVLISE